MGELNLDMSGRAPTRARHQRCGAAAKHANPLRMVKAAVVTPLRGMRGARRTHFYTELPVVAKEE